MKKAIWKNFKLDIFEHFDQIFLEFRVSQYIRWREAIFLPINSNIVSLFSYRAHMNNIPFYNEFLTKKIKKNKVTEGSSFLDTLNELKQADKKTSDLDLSFSLDTVS